MRKVAEQQCVRKVASRACPPSEAEGELHGAWNIRAELFARVVEETRGDERLGIGEDLLIARDRVVIRHNCRALGDEVPVVVVVLDDLARNCGSRSESGVEGEIGVTH